MIQQKVCTWPVWGIRWRLLYFQGKAEGAPVGGTVPDDESARLLVPQKIDCWNSLWLEVHTLYIVPLYPIPKWSPQRSHLTVCPSGSPVSCLLSVCLACFPMRPAGRPPFCSLLFATSFITMTPPPPGRPLEYRAGFTLLSSNARLKPVF